MPATLHSPQQVVTAPGSLPTAERAVGGGAAPEEHCRGSHGAGGAEAEVGREAGETGRLADLPVQGQVTCFRLCGPQTSKSL